MQVVIKRLDEMILGAEVMVSVAERNACLLGNRAHGCLFVATLVKHVQRRCQDERFGLFTLRGLRRLIFWQPSSIYLLKPATRLI